MNKIVIVLLVYLVSIVSFGEEDSIIYTNFHVVSEGETLEDISEEYGVSKESIISINNLKKDISEGQSLYIDLGEYKERWIDIDLSGGRNISSGERVIKGRNAMLPVSRQREEKPDFLWPVEWQGVTSEWGYRVDPITGAEKAKHSGIDLRARIGTPVHAPATGIVRNAGWMRGYGRIVIIDHDNGYSTRFAHLDEYLVEVGDTVEKGHLIAKTGNTGRSTGPHLHYEIRRDESPLNPLNFRF